MTNQNLDHDRTIKVPTPLGNEVRVTRGEFCATWERYASELLSLGLDFNDQVREAAGKRFDETFKEQANETD